MPIPTPIRTCDVTGRRPLHFNTIDDALADVERLAAAEKQGRLKRLGNWTFGQILGHLASWARYSYDGVPIKVPFFIRWVVRPLKRRAISKPMPAGRSIPRVPGGTVGTDNLSTDEGLARFRESFTRLKDECPGRPHLLFGKLTHDQWINLNLRHAELHLSFVTTT